MLRTSVWILHQYQNVFQRTYWCNIGRTTCATRVVILRVAYLCYMRCNWRDCSDSSYCLRASTVQCPSVLWCTSMYIVWCPLHLRCNEHSLTTLEDEKASGSKSRNRCVCHNSQHSQLTSSSSSSIGIAMGVQWVHLHPPGRWNKLGVIYRENV